MTKIPRYHAYKQLFNTLTRQGYHHQCETTHYSNSTIQTWINNETAEIALIHIPAMDHNHCSLFIRAHPTDKAIITYAPPELHK